MRIIKINDRLSVSGAADGGGFRVACGTGICWCRQQQTGWRTGRPTGSNAEEQAAAQAGLAYAHIPVKGLRLHAVCGACSFGPSLTLRKARCLLIVRAGRALSRYMQLARFFSAACGSVRCANSATGSVWTSRAPGMAERKTAKNSRCRMAVSSTSGSDPSRLPPASVGVPPDALDFENKAGEVAELLKTLANRNRLMIACALVNSELSVSQMEEELHICQPTLSQQLTVLRSARVVETNAKIEADLLSIVGRKSSAPYRGLARDLLLRSDFAHCGPSLR